MIVEAALDLSVLVGDWRNTNPAAGIGRIVVEPNGSGGVRVHVASSTRDWGKVDAPVFAFDFEEVRLQANVKLGVLVVASFNTFKDDSGRSSYFNREFFYRV